MIVAYFYTKMRSTGHLVQKLLSGNTDRHNRHTDTQTCVKPLPTPSRGGKNLEHNLSLKCKYTHTKIFY